MPTADSTKSRLALAMRHHQSGALPEAEEVYRSILERSPHDADVLHLLGLVRFQRCDYREADRLMVDAVRIVPHPTIYTNLGASRQQQGKLSGAVEAYRNALALSPTHAEAHHNLGTVFQEQNRTEDAIAAFRRALALRPGYAEAWNNLGTALREHQQLADAAAAFRQALVLKSDYAEASNNLGTVRYEQGDPEGAVLAHRRALVLRPDHAEAYNNLAATFRSQKAPDAALATVRRALMLRPVYAEAYGTLGNALQAAGRTEQAVLAWRAYLALAPDRVEPCAGLAPILESLKRTDEAIRVHRVAAKLRPDDAGRLTTLGNVLRSGSRLDEAIGQYRKALALEPDRAETFFNLGSALREGNRLPEAGAAFRIAVRVAPDRQEIHNSLGLTFQDLGRLPEAAEAYRRAVALSPAVSGPHSNLGVVLNDLGVLDDAERTYRRAIALRPDFADARCNLSLLLLIRGRFREGWDEYEWRWGLAEMAKAKPALTEPLWTGEIGAGRTILLHAEQGLGDSIQFVRYVPMVIERGWRVVLLVQKPLMRLFRTLVGGGPDVTIIGSGEPPPPFQAQCPLLSLPRAFSTTLPTIPAQVPYLQAEPELVAAWRDRLPRDGIRIGVVWQGNPAGKVDRGRSYPLACLEPVARMPGVRLISLQKNFGLEQLKALPAGMEVETLGDAFDSGPDAFLDTAAVMMNLDLVITSDTSVAHLAGALGRPVWVPLKTAADWRWLRDREDSPWYPTLRLFRQTTAGEWGSVFARMARALTNLTADGAVGPEPSQRTVAEAACVINLARRRDRRDTFLRNNAGKGFHFVVREAVDGQSLSRQELAARGLIAEPALTFSDGAIGNALSHRQMWEDCARTGRNRLVFEDDAFLHPDLSTWLPRLHSALEGGCDILYLGYNWDAWVSVEHSPGLWSQVDFSEPSAPFDTLCRSYEGGGVQSLLLPARQVWGTLAYLVSPGGAAKLLATSFPLSAQGEIRMFGQGRRIRPSTLDGIINRSIQSGLITAQCLVPPLVIGPNNHEDSDVVPGGHDVI
ncbi:tetratricopeptide repeat protein [Azospirillum isscasi]|uniref:Tetratricopeptide repeat protein n=1 Tax=Azospirillum isscasi TaxID=3053926 RepID=A0ABU0WCJ7_9PROT|nr:tetratricopeptide repeat protein [Azospirillum isscasi]MDQ2101916.1 tetratricopeptide repeat protein [Azospirillum isscasi]